ncbi:MAG: SDR family NAD(P)-dependent oxidoreductase [Burkholderiaceae bacterium]
MKPASTASADVALRAGTPSARPRGWFAPLNTPITDWRGKTAWIVGASTGIGRATAVALHARGARVVASARNVQALDTLSQECPGLIAVALDTTDAQAVQQATQQVLAQCGAIDLAMYCAGHYKAQRATAFDLADMLRHDQVNYVGALNMLDAVLPQMLARGTGHLSLVSSVAGYRGLPNGLAYGPTKAALTNLAETLYVDLQDAGIGVSLVSPGFVETPLTAQNRFHMPALITADEAAREIVQGWQRGAFEIHFPLRFTLWMKALQLLPNRLYFAVVRRFTGL